nr:integrase, catalytic region, zinc finger, CCHC-type, peptidase aspartic, catalytic [Tanacetum cinerariifolium]
MSRDVLTVGSTMRIPLLYRGEYSQWVERFINYLEEQTDGEAMINSIKNGDQPLPRVTQVSIAGTSSTEQLPLKDKSMCNKTAKDLWDALSRHMLASEYGKQDRKAAVLCKYETFKATEGELLLDTYIRYLQVINDLKKCGYSKDNCELNFKFLNNLQPERKQYATMTRQNKNLMDINIDALYNILKQNQGDVNDTMGLKKKTVLVTSDPLALIAEKTKVSKRKEKVVVSSDSEGSDADDFSELKKITALLAKAFNRQKFYSKPTNNNLRTSSTSHSTNKKQEFVKLNDKKVEKKDDEKKRDMSKVKFYNCKKEGHFAKHCKKVKEINANMVFMAQIEKVLSNSETSSSSADDKISEVSYYLSESESEYEYETLDYYDNTTTYGLFLNDNDDQEIFYDCENFLENLIESQINHNESGVDHNDSEGVDKLIQKFNKKIAKCLKRIEKANQQNKDFENQNKDLQDKYDIVQICLWIIDSRCSKHKMSNHTLLTNFVEKCLGTVRFGKNDFAMIAGYGDVVIGSMTIKKVYYVEGLGHNLFSVGQFCDKGLEVAF